MWVYISMTSDCAQAILYWLRFEAILAKEFGLTGNVMPVLCLGQESYIGITCFMIYVCFIVWLVGTFLFTAFVVMSFELKELIQELSLHVYYHLVHLF